MAVGEVEEQERDSLFVGGYALGGKEELDGARVARPRGGGRGGNGHGRVVLLVWEELALRLSWLRLTGL